MDPSLLRNTPRNKSDGLISQPTWYEANRVSQVTPCSSHHGTACSGLKNARMFSLSMLLESDSLPEFPDLSHFLGKGILVASKKSRDLFWTNPLKRFTAKLHSNHSSETVTRRWCTLFFGSPRQIRQHPPRLERRASEPSSCHPRQRTDADALCTPVAC